MPKALPVQLKKFKRGDQIFASNSRPTHFYIVQSGLVTVCLIKEDCAQLQLVGPMQCLREEVLMSGPPSGTTAYALRDTQLLEIPVETVKAQLGTAPAPLGVLTKGILERLKAGVGELRSLKINRDARPCPPDLTAKAFGVTFYTARYVGKKDGDSLVVDWKALKAYAMDVFAEPLCRLEEVIHILTKLGYAEPWTEKSKEHRSIPPSEQWSQVCFRNMTQIETFFDFYQNYHFKGGYAAFLRTDEKSTLVTQAMVQLSEKYKVDRSGMVAMPYKPSVDALKEALGKTFEADQIFRLEQKGLCVKRISTQDGGLLSFYKPEFEQMLLNWKVLRQVELWNAKGYVELPKETPADDPAKGAPVAEKESAQVQAAVVALESWKPLVVSGGTPVIRTDPARPNENLCPFCMSPVLASQTYCPICDSDLTKTAA